MKIGIIGGGLMGLALAERLGALGHQVHVIERGKQVGGLTTWHDFGSFVWDRFYHVILPTDRSLIRFIHDIGLGERLCWRETQTGFYVDQQFHPMSNTVDFIRFPVLSLWGKFRLALTMIYGSRIDDWRRLEKVSVEDWLVRVSGRNTYEKMWKPLLLAKLGENYKRVSAVFIWSYIKRLFSARDSSAQKEHMGYVEGGYRTVFERLLESIAGRGGKVSTQTAVAGIAPDGRAGIWVEHGGQREHFDKVVFTGPVNVLRQVAPRDLARVTDSGRSVEYLGVICMVLVTRKPLTPYYVLNIADSRIPFTGVIGMSGVVDTEQTAGRYLTYLPKYVLSDDPLLEESDAALRESFMAGVRLMYPDFDFDAIESVHINRAVKVQPLQVLDYSSIVPQVASTHPDFFVVNTSQFVNNTLNNNAVITAVDQFVEEFAPAFERADEGAGAAATRVASA